MISQKKLCDTYTIKHAYQKVKMRFHHPTDTKIVDLKVFKAKYLRCNFNTARLTYQ